jgi:hypothetical protein
VLQIGVGDGGVGREEMRKKRDKMSGMKNRGEERRGEREEMGEKVRRKEMGGEDERGES